MRIVGGLYRHRLIAWPDDAEHIRPTKDRVREAIFSALGDLSHRSVLDLYAGSGAMGLEALSRGASIATFVDDSPIAIETIKKNTKSLNIPLESQRILAISDKKALLLFASEGQRFDLIILDPPYREGQYNELVNDILGNNLLSDDGIIVIESDQNIVLSQESWRKRKDYHYGEIKVTILWR